ncbi:tripartite tricarboxylate transporter TctB family protein [Ancylobacter sonchi]|uniref:tripartite tricarboxylate transporter TctB family protein n=1 Tax=Ancylobacter sonchi TaxID=1937790 RepID=UPI001BD57AFE|nr:tripartite tricarboxylate transporter TctB family protein [Ancylobacter sonchi]MBS7532468.1 tripartite tricarboxylate transporter TctB family protein [Ancylobacter sonchi]
MSQHGHPPGPPSRPATRRPNNSPLFFSGLVFLAIGAAGILIARHYQMGTVQNMGPGYFPILLSSLLCIIGVLSVISSLATASREEMAAWPLMPTLSVALGVFVFGFTVERIGLLGASALLLLCIGYSQIRTRPLEYLLLATGLIVFSALIFVKMLGLPLELWPNF